MWKNEAKPIELTKNEACSPFVLHKLRKLKSVLSQLSPSCIFFEYLFDALKWDQGLNPSLRKACIWQMLRLGGSTSRPDLRPISDTFSTVREKIEQLLRLEMHLLLLDLSHYNV